MTHSAILKPNIYWIVSSKLPYKEVKQFNSNGTQISFTLHWSLLSRSQQESFVRFSTKSNKKSLLSFNTKWNSLFKILTSVFNFFHWGHCSDRISRFIKRTVWICDHFTHYCLTHFWAPATTVWYISLGSGSNHREPAWNSRDGTLNCCCYWRALSSR